MKPKPAPQVVIDTREQRPWSFPADVATTRAGLPAGDYSVVGLEEVIAVERKSLADFVASVTHERERFWRELEVLSTYHRAAVIVEADASAILAGAYRSRAHPRSVWASLLAITADFRIPVLLAGDEPAAAASCLWLLRRWCSSLEAAPLPHALAASSPPSGEDAPLLVSPLDAPGAPRPPRPEAEAHRRAPPPRWASFFVGLHVAVDDPLTVPQEVSRR